MASFILPLVALKLRFTARGTIYSNGWTRVRSLEERRERTRFPRHLVECVLRRLPGAAAAPRAQLSGCTMGRHLHRWCAASPVPSTRPMHTSTSTNPLPPSCLAPCTETTTGLSPNTISRWVVSACNPPWFPNALCWHLKNLTESRVKHHFGCFLPIQGESTSF